MLTSEQIRAARALLRWHQKDLARISGISKDTVLGLERQTGEVDAHVRTVSAVTTAFETAGIVFIPENGGGPGVRLKEPVKKPPRQAPSK